MNLTTRVRSPRRSLARLQPALLPLLLALAVSGQAQAQSSDNSQSTDQSTQKKSTKTDLHTLQTVQVQGAAGTYGGDFARRGTFGVLGDSDMLDTPFSMVSYTDAYIAKQQAYTVADVVAYDPAVRVTDGYGTFAEVFIMRGFPLDGDDITYDGLYGITPRQLVLAGNIGRVDVLRGSNAFLYGVSPDGTGLGGAINIEPKYADDAPLNRVTFNLGSDTQAGAQLDFSRRFGAGDRFGIRVNAGGMGGSTAVDQEGRHSNYQSISFDYRGDRFRVKANLSHQLQRIDQGRNVVYLEGEGVPKAPDASKNYAQPWSYYSMEDTYGVVRAEYDFLPNLTGYVAAGGDHSNENSQSASPTVNSAGVGYESRLGVPYNNDAWSGEAGLNGYFETGPVSQKVNLGLSDLIKRSTTSYTYSGSYDVDLYNYVPVAYPQDAGDAGDPVVTSRVKLHSIALSDTLGFFDDRLLVTLGARRQDMTVLGYAYTTGVMTSSYRAHALSPVMGAVYKINPNLSVFANSIQGLSQGPSAPLNTANYGQVFAPYKTRQFETGVKYDAGSYGSTLSLFQIKEPSGITDPNTKIYSVNGMQRNRGVEWSAYGMVAPGLKILGGATFLDPTLTKTDNGQYNGYTAPGTSKWQYNLSADWMVPQGHGLDFGLGLVRTGGQYVDDGNTESIPAWTRVDASMGYATQIGGKNVNFRFAVLNVANNAYWESAYDGYLTEGMAREFKVSASIDF